MEPMTDELKETIIREQPGGIWLVLAEEYLPDVITPENQPCDKNLARTILFPVASR